MKIYIDWERLSSYLARQIDKAEKDNNKSQMKFWRRVYGIMQDFADIEQEPKFIAKSDGTIEQIKNCDDCIFKKEWEKIGKLLSVVLEKQTEKEPKTEWVPVKWHIKTEEDEYERYPDGVAMIDSPMPEDGQEILITLKAKSGYCWVEKTIACCDDVDGWYTDDGFEWIDDIVAWMPLPEPYKEG